jgi:hypothetical protein
LREASSSTRIQPPSAGGVNFCFVPVATFPAASRSHEVVKTSELAGTIDYDFMLLILNCNFESYD